MNDTRIFEATFRLRDGRMIFHTGSLAEIEALWHIHRLKMKEMRIKQIAEEETHGR